MKAKSKAIEIIEIDSLDVEYANRLNILKVKSPPERGGTVKMLSSPEELIDILKNKEGII